MSVKDPNAFVAAALDPELSYPQPWMPLKEPVNPYTDYHAARTDRYLQPLMPVITADGVAIRRMLSFEQRRPGFHTEGGEIYTHRESGSATTKLVFRGRDGRERVLVDDFSPSLEFPGVYPTGFWLSPDGRHVIYSSADAVDEGGAALHMVRTDTGAAVGDPVPRSQFPSGTWIDDKRFVFSVLGRGRDKPWSRHWRTYVRHLADDGSFRDEALPGIERAPDDSRYDFVPGPLPGTVTVLAYSAILQTPQTILVADLDGRGRGFVIQHESEGVLGRVRPAPGEGSGPRRLFVLRLDRRSYSGRVVVVDPPRTPGGRPRRRQLVAGRRGDVIREMEVVDRGPGQPPALALSIRRHGAEARVDVVSLKKTAKWRSGLKKDHRWTVPLPGAQEIRGTSRRRRDRTKGWYGTISALTATPSGLDIEYSARESVPHRLYRLDHVVPGAVPTMVAGPNSEAVRAAGVPEIDVALHRPRVGLFRRTALHVVRPKDAPADRPLPELYSAYPYYFLGGHTQDFTPLAAAIVAKGIAWSSHYVYGTGAHGYDEMLGSRETARLRALKEMLVALRYLDKLPGLAGRGQRTGFFQSAGGSIGLDALRHSSSSFRTIFFNRPMTNVITNAHNSQRVHMDVTDPSDRRAGYAHAGGIIETPASLPENVVFTLGSSDPRIPDYTVRMTAAAFEEARSRHLGDKLKAPGGIRIVEQKQSGHFPGGDEQAVISAIVGNLAGIHPSPRPEPNTNAAPTHPGVVVPLNQSAPQPVTPAKVPPSVVNRLPRDQPTTATTSHRGRRITAKPNRTTTRGLSPVRRLTAKLAAIRNLADPHDDRTTLRRAAARTTEVEGGVPQLNKQYGKQR